MSLSVWPARPRFPFGYIAFNCGSRMFVGVCFVRFEEGLAFCRTGVSKTLFVMDFIFL